MAGIDLELEHLDISILMRNGFDFGQGVHLVLDGRTYLLCDILYVLKSADDAIVVHSEEERASLSVGKGAHALEPALGLLLFEHLLEVVCRTFGYEILDVHKT